MIDSKLSARNFLEGFNGQESDEEGVWQEVLEPKQASQIFLDSRRLPPPVIGDPFAFWGPRKKIQWV